MEDHGSPALRRLIEALPEAEARALLPDLAPAAAEDVDDES